MRFMGTSLSKLVDSFTEGIHNIKYKDYGCFLEYENVMGNLIKYDCLSCNKENSNKLNEELKKKFKNTFKFTKNDINRFILLLGKGVYSYRYMEDWEKINETTLPEKEIFYSNLTIEDVTETDCNHGKRVWKDFEINKLGKYHGFCLRSEALLLADVFENVGFSNPGLA